LCQNLVLQKLLFIVSVFLAVSACSLTATKIAEVDSQVTRQRETGLTCFPREIDRCAPPSPLMDLGRENLQSGSHHVTLVEHGEDALKLRIHLIRSASKFIEIQNFILRTDDTGQLFLHELLSAARRGVKVRLLLDQMFSGTDLEYLVKLTMDHINLEVRFYNPTFDKAKMSKGDWLKGVACCFRRFQQRMHNKLFVVDDVVGVTGGRNISDRYFDYDTNYEFKDRDVVVFGPAVREMRESFDWFWESPSVVPVQHLRDVAHKLLTGAPTRLDHYQPTTRLAPLLRDILDPMHMKALFVIPAYPVDRLEYFSDQPRKAEFPDDSSKRDITAELHQVLSTAEHSIVIQSPYMVLSKKARKVFEKLRAQNPDIELVFSTNSLASTDADTVYAHTHKHKKYYVKTLGFHLYEFKPFPIDAPEFFHRWAELIAEKEQGIGSKSVVSGDQSTIDMPAPRVGLHGKSFVVDSKIAMIGSHNFDPRSEGFNTENGIIIWDEDFAQALEYQMRKDTEPQNSWVVAMKPDVGEVGGAIESVSRTLPVFDLWPYRSRR
jgi:phosphatidylserine/phosphatidylglycerophosphate/cardiolipin synthase-like enzyme